MSVKIIEIKTSESNSGKSFVSLKIQGGVEAVQSQQTGKMYLTFRTCLLPTTFSEEVAKSLIGSQLPGAVQRVACEPYEYVVKDTGEVIMLSHKYEYVPTEATEVPVVSAEVFTNIEL
jgi:hypothetical protein